MKKNVRTIDVVTARAALGKLGPELSWTFDSDAALRIRGALADDGVAIVTPGVLGNGGAIEFNGAGGYYAIDAARDLRPVPDYSVSAWFEADRVSGKQTLLSYAGKGTGNGLEYEIGLKGSKVVVTLEGSDGKVVLASGKGAIGTDTPHHVALTLDGNLAALHVDGIQVAKAAIPGAEGLADLPLLLGASNAKSNAETVDRPNGYFDGTIDDVAVFDRALSASEIKQLAGSTSSPPPPPPPPPPAPPPPPPPQSEDKTIDILIVGDSLTVNNSPWVGGGKSFGTLLESFLESHGYDVDVSSISVSGYTINQGLNVLTGFFNNGGKVPDAAIVALGTNDRFQNVPTSSSAVSYTHLSAEPARCWRTAADRAASRYPGGARAGRRGARAACPGAGRGSRRSPPSAWR